GPVPTLRGGRDCDVVRPAIRHQHGGEYASHAGQGHDAAVHLVWGLLDDLARLGHGNAARLDARAAADRDPVAPRRARCRWERGLMADAPVVVLAAGGTGGPLFSAPAPAGGGPP